MPKRQRSNSEPIDALKAYGKPYGFNEELEGKFASHMNRFTHDKTLRQLGADPIKRIAGSLRAMCAQAPYHPEVTAEHKFISDEKAKQIVREAISHVFRRYEEATRVPHLRGMKRWGFGLSYQKDV
jgi:hypothetical protein